MATLKHRLDQLAEDAPDGAPPTALGDNLWRKGKRVQRRRSLVTTAFVAALVVGIGAFSSMVVDATSYSVPVADAEAEAALGLPSRLYTPSPWGPGTDETGPIGPLVALVGAYRSTTWGEQTAALAGVSAAGGYAFLPLDNLARTDMTFDGGPAVLSPDGRWVAHYVTGATTLEPYRGQGDPVVGVALYDTVTGETRRTVLETDHGLSVDDLVWVGDTLLTEYGQITDFSDDGNSMGASIVGFLRWDAATGDLNLAVSAKDYPNLYRSTPGPDGTLVLRTGRCAFSVMSADGSTEQLGRLDVRCEGEVFLSPGGLRVSSTVDVDGPARKTSKPSPIVVADVAGPDAGVTRELDEDLVDSIVGWADDTHLLVGQVRDADQSLRFVSVDVETGERAEVLRQPLGGVEFPTQIASGALTGPGFTAPEPDFPGNPRYVWGLGAVIVILVGGNLLWRRRVRR